MQAPVLLRVNEVSKAFAAPVLKAINFAIASGEVVALTGENGAGKSTLSKIIAGVSTADSGNMMLDGQAYSPSTRTQAEQLGVRMVLQELGLIGTLTVAENLELGSLPSQQGFIKRGELERRARVHLDRVGLTDVHPSQPVGDLGIGQQQLVEIARGLKSAAKLLILDEPTAMLTTNEVDRLFVQIAQLKGQGVAIIYISHRLDELSRIADRVVVLRDGSLVADRSSAMFHHDDIVRAMVGDIVTSDANRPRRKAGAEVLRLQNLGRGHRVRAVTLSLHAGEILGVAGLVGSGRTELLRLMFGADRKTSGEMLLDDRSINILSPTQAVEHGIGWLTEDRKSEGLFLTQSININLTVANLATVSQRGWISQALERSAVMRWLQRLRIRARDEQCVAELSGGNQQKVLLARWLHRDCRILLLDEPTRGVDIGARADIYAELEALAAAGKALLVVSSDLRELMDLCDRIAVMSNGALVQIVPRGEWSEQMLLAAAFSGHVSATRAAVGLQ